MAAASADLDVVRVVNDEELRDVDPIAGVRVVALGQLGSFLAGLENAQRERLAAVVASQGHYDEIALEKILDAGPIGFCGLVASRKRAADVFGVLAQSGARREQIQTVRNPVGLDIGARSASEVAVSILAELIAHAPAIAVDATELATDPVCGMDVEIATARHRATQDGQPFFFCGAGCLAAFEQEPARYADAART
jgi:xanthine dehydrogenase accessory factor